MDNLRFEKEYALKGYKNIAGTDEAGRGPLAGPVVCACCIMPLDNLIDGVKDSKKLTEKQRENLYRAITERAVSFAVSVIDRDEIDKINIYNAARLGMQRAVEAMHVRPDFVLADGNMKLNLPMPYLSVVKGDDLSYNISAASIIAKVTRDRLMIKYDKQYPQYNFAANKGYPTAEHYKRLAEFGECPLHRKTFLTKFYQGGALEND